MFIGLLITGLYGTIVSYLYIRARISLSKAKAAVKILQGQNEILKKQRDNNITDVDDADKLWNNWKK